jgi:hypothetical protein
MRMMKQVMYLATGASLLLSLAACSEKSGASARTSGAQRQEPAAAAARARVGTVKRDRLVMAYYASELVGEDLRKLKEAHSAAKAAGDLAKVADLERQGEAMQAAAHKQMWENESIAPIMERLRERLTEVAREAGVEQIVVEDAATQKGSATVDVTEQVVALLPMRSDLKQRATLPGR